MRIATYVIEFPSISETFVLAQIVGLLERGHDVRIIARRRGSGAPTHEHVRGHGLLDRATFLDERHGAAALATGALRSPRVVADGLLRRVPTSMRDLVALARAVRRLDPDVLHCHFGPNGAMAADLRATGAIGVPIVTTYHGIDLSRILVEHGVRFYERLFRHGALHLPVSHRFAETLVSAGCPGERTRVHHMGIPLDQFPYRERRHEPGAPVRMLSVARLVPKKAIDDAVRAALRLRAAGHHIRYTIVGDGPQRPFLQTLIDEADAGSDVRLLGWRTIDEVRRLADEHDLCVAPSVTAADGDQEGIPTTIMEGMASGMPVISARHSGIPELVEDGRTGLLVAEGDVDALTEAMRRLCVSPADWPAYGRAGRAVVERDFDASKLNDRLAGLLEAAASAEVPPADAGP
jgi:colanic acid/amylovoran biosynthesis glycosyltransferase